MFADDECLCIYVVHTFRDFHTCQSHHATANSTSCTPRGSPIALCYRARFGVLFRNVADARLGNHFEFHCMRSCKAVPRIAMFQAALRAPHIHSALFRIDNSTSHRPTIRCFGGSNNTVSMGHRLATACRQSNFKSIVR